MLNMNNDEVISEKDSVKSFSPLQSPEMRQLCKETSLLAYNENLSVWGHTINLFQQAMHDMTENKLMELGLL